MADSAGFKYSSIRSLKEQKAISNYTDFEKITVEILSTERIDVPIAVEGRVYPDDDYLKFLIDNANTCLNRANNKLNNLFDVLNERLLD
jgi:tRNA wybutosine-synthesizing protein 3